MVPESLVTGSKAHAAKTKQDHNLEASGPYRTCYPYRRRLRAGELALASRAARTSFLQVFLRVACRGRDESHAYVRKQRTLIFPLNQRLSLTWDYGPWAEGFYAQLCIRVVSSHGLTERYTPFEGYSHGNHFSANG